MILTSKSHSLCLIGVICHPGTHDIWVAKLACIFPEVAEIVWLYDTAGNRYGKAQLLDRDKITKNDRLVKFLKFKFI